MQDEIDWASLPEVMGVEEAAEVIGIHKQSLMYHVQKGNIVPYRPGGCLAFTPHMLRDFLKVHQVKGEGPGLTKKEIAEKFGISVSLVTYYQNTKRLNAIGKRNQAWVFREEDAARLFGEDAEGE